MDNLAVIDGCDTTPRLFRSRCGELGTVIAMREKEFGIWHSFSWNDYYDKAKCIGIALIALGLEPGQVASILSENNKEWLFVDMATMCVGGISNGVYTTDSYSQLKHVCVDSQTRILFVEDEEQLDKFLEIEKELPLVQKVVVFDDDGLKTFSHPKVMFMDELYDLGRKNFEKLQNEFDTRLENVRPEDTAILVYTSGTTGPPKGAMLTHQNLLFQARNAGSWIGDEAREEIISILPLCHIAERTFSVFLPLNFKWIVNFVESPETSFENTMEVSPTLFFGVPRMWEKMHSNTVIKINEAVWLGRIAYELALKIGGKYAEYIDAGGKPNLLLRLGRLIAEKTVFRNLKIMLGLDRARILFTGAAPVSP
ncbi:MAG: AMP-binding protein, partial [Pseudomonadota bacterium]|nr:AMP-binding protein [Pseudomonadota bacterium]